MAPTSLADVHAVHADSHLAHHFRTPGQQFESSKLGMWLFLVTEILLFSGLFCVYAVYRGTHPEIFARGHEYLDKGWGALNTVILLCSSFTMATAVHAAQRSRQKLLAWMLGLTLLGGFGFLGIKFVEYHHKWKHHLLWGRHFQPHAAPAAARDQAGAPSFQEQANGSATAATARSPQMLSDAEAAARAGVSERWEFEPAASGPRGLLRGAHSPGPEPAAMPREVRNVQQFFAIYFAMTGLHGLHVVAGMVVLAWLLGRALKGHFDASYFTPVDLGGLYWHLVDLIWIYLFPLLYLIH